MNTEFNILKKIITERRTRKVALMSGEPIPEEIIDEILSVADYAPTHGRTEPWRIQIFNNSSLHKFCVDHAQLYWDHTDESLRTEARFELFRDMYQYASHLLVVCMKRTEGTKIPAIEEYASCCAAAQNMLLAAEALGVSAIWNTGGMTYTEAMKNYLNLHEDDMVVGLLYMGYVDSAANVKTASRKIPISEKIIKHS